MDICFSVREVLPLLPNTSYQEDVRLTGLPTTKEQHGLLNLRNTQIPQTSAANTLAVVTSARAFTRHNCPIPSSSAGTSITIMAPGHDHADVSKNHPGRAGPPRLYHRIQVCTQGVHKPFSQLGKVTQQLFIQVYAGHTAQ